MWGSTSLFQKTVNPSDLFAKIEHLHSDAGISPQGSVEWVVPDMLDLVTAREPLVRPGPPPKEPINQIYRRTQEQVVCGSLAVTKGKRNIGADVREKKTNYGNKSLTFDRTETQTKTPNSYERKEVKFKKKNTANKAKPKFNKRNKFSLLNM
ncbi:unnamed protein product [Strongylus vulgaris]|uniref:Uncharacterized protein n=1 Tax=Strongylus vulgaris TaxID=40348 RepID=A0A3P7I3A9_STRVU|nr:unnamed protein product [Strongylus vulgaris]